MRKEKITKPDVVILLTEEQMQTISPLLKQRVEKIGGLIFGSVGLAGNTVALSYIPQKVGEQIRDLAFQEIGENNDVNS